MKTLVCRTFTVNLFGGGKRTVTYEDMLIESLYAVDQSRGVLVDDIYDLRLDLIDKINAEKKKKGREIQFDDAHMELIASLVNRMRYKIVDRCFQAFRSDINELNKSKGK